MLNFDQLKTPPNDGDLLIEPEVSCWPNLIEQADRSIGSDPPTLADVSLAEVRQATRLMLFGDRADFPVIACGHQPAFVHPGVWAKDVAVRCVAEQLGINGAHLVADNGAMHDSAIAVPVVELDTLPKLRQVALGPAPSGAAYEGQPICEQSAIESARQHFEELLGERFTNSCIGDFLDGLSRFCDTAGTTVRAPSAREGLAFSSKDPRLRFGPVARRAGIDVGEADFVRQYLVSRTRIDAPFLADLPQIRISQAFGGPFVADLLLNAECFALAYNDALSEYRVQYRVRSAQRPLPDLGRVGGALETALWIYKPLEPRQRLWVRLEGDAVHLYADQTLVTTLSVTELRCDPDKALSVIQPWIIRPRALTLTLWARLLVCDLFVHGIGGAKYDRITDGILRRYYHWGPAPYACVSATLRLPLPHQSASSDMLSVASHESRDLHFNPDRYLRDAPVELLTERRRLIDESDRLRDTHGSAHDRREAFLGIRQVNARLVESDPRIERELTERIDCLRRQLQGNRIADGREYFYALQPRQRLAWLADRLITACGQVKS